jgi:hypothetical protein
VTDSTALNVREGIFLGYVLEPYMTTILIIVLLVVLLGGGGGYYGFRRRG